MSKTIYALTLVAAFGLSAGAGAALAAPATSPHSSVAITNENPNLINVAKWDRDRHGRRCSHRNDRCRHHYRGHYYETPWWTLPLIIGGGFAADRDYDDGYYADGGGHVQWCLDRYRSYNLRTNTWVSYSGRVRECVSPFS